MRIRIKKIKRLALKILTNSVRHVITTCLILLVSAFLVGGLLFYKYSILAKEAKPATFDSFQLREDAYQGVLSVWQEREKRLEEADFKQYPDLFRD